MKPYSEESERLIDVANKLCKLSTPDLRKVIEAVVDEVRDTHTDIDEWSKIYILNRVAFEVPNKYSKKARGNHGIFFGGWGGVPTSRNFANIRWPVDYRPDGKAEIVGSFGGYMGDSYLAVAEFDFFAEQFPRRK